MSLTSEEQNELARLMNKVEFPVAQEIFYAWCKNFAVPSVEIGLMREGKNGRDLYLTYREDDFFKGWHLPGSVVRPGDTIDGVLQRIEQEELHSVQLIPKFSSWFEYPKGTNPGQSRRGHVIALLFTTEAPNEIAESPTAKFFPLSNIPDDLISEHVPVVELLQKH